MTVADEGVRRRRYRTFGIVDHSTVCLNQAGACRVCARNCPTLCSGCLQGTCLRLSTTDADAATQWIAHLRMNGCEHRELNEEAKAQEPLRSMELSAVRSMQPRTVLQRTIATR